MTDTAIQLMHGDCLSLMADIPDGSVDAIVTDPPYGVDFRGNAWDSNIPGWIAEARRIAPIVVFTTAPTTLWDYPRPDWVGCWYREASNSRSVMGGFNHWSPVVIYGKPRFKVDSKKLHAIQHAAPKDIGHPSPKPLALMEWLVTSSVGEGMTVLDPFMGSGTTGVACVNTNRHFIGIEQDAGYFTIAQERIRKAQEAARQLTLEEVA
jgi:site-specific DNA-methyltransferase (adenine-specific)